MRYNKYKVFCLPFSATGLFIKDCDNFTDWKFFYAKGKAFAIMA